MNDDCGVLFGAHRCKDCGTTIIYPTGAVPEPCRWCRIAALESELAAAREREARLRGALAELQSASDAPQYMSDLERYEAAYDRASELLATTEEKPCET